MSGAAIQSRVRRGSLGVVACLAGALMVGPLPLAAQDGPGFRFGFGWQEPTGDLGDVLDGHVDAELSVLIPVSVLRVGGGANWASFDVTGAEASWSQIRFHALVGIPFRLSERVHPYVEGRWTYRHLRPEDDRYFGGEDEVLRDFKSEGGGFEVVSGIELFLSSRVALDVLAAFGTYGFDPDLSEEGLGAVDSGSSWRAQLGVTWFPTHGR